MDEVVLVGVGGLEKEKDNLNKEAAFFYSKLVREGAIYRTYIPQIPNGFCFVSLRDIFIYLV